VNITPALPNPYPSPVDQERTAVAAVRAPNPPRNPADEPERRQPLLQAIDPAAHERIVARAGALVTPHHEGSSLANRALASYAQIADSGDPSGLRELLGFDAYA
jgi:hypothetical protein